MAIALVVTSLGTFGGSGGTTVGVNTTGANLIVIGLNYQSASGKNISDNKGNTWTQVEAQDAGNSACVLYYCSNPTVGSGHTFSTTSHFCNVFVAAFSGARTATTPLDQHTSAQTGTNSTATGSITTSVAGCVCFAVYGGFNPGLTPSITSGGTGWTVPSGWAIGTSTSECGEAAYKIESGTATENVTFTSVNSISSTAAIASFMPPAVASANGNFLAFM